MLRIYKTYNSTVRFSKYEFCNKLLSGVTLLRITPGVTWTQSIYIYIYIYIERERERDFQDTYSIILSCVTLPNNLFLNSYFENSTVELHIIYVFNMNTSFHVN